MSHKADGLAQKVQAVIAEHLAESGGMVTGFILSVDYIDDAGDRSWISAHAEDQAITTTLGILDWYSMWVKDTCVRSLRSGESGD